MRIHRLNPQDIFIRRIQNALLQECIAGWQRRGKLLLDINCGDGRFLRPLWRHGFDVTATELDPKLRSAAKRGMLDRAEIYAADATHLPFDDRTFDWAVLHLTGHDEDLQAVLQEAVRVAAHGLAVTFWNTSSPVFLLTPKDKIAVRGYPWYTVRNAVRREGDGTISTRSTLLCAFPFLRRQCPRIYFMSHTTRLPLGAWATLRLDMSPQSTVTPLALFTRLRKMSRLEPVLECNRTQRRDQECV